MKKLCYVLLSLFLLIILASCDNPYDVIEKYNINITTNDDATLNIEYDIDWKVLVSGDDDFVLIGVPNAHCRVVEFDDTDVKSAYYVYDDGHYVRLNLRKSFVAGDELDLKFKIHQDYMFTVGEINSDKYINYSFIPGWFDEIEVKNITVKWDSTNVVEADSSATLVDNSYVWSYALEPGESIKCNVSYKIESFPNVDINRQVGNAKDPSDDSETVAMIIFFVIAVFTVFIIIAAIIGAKNSTSYYVYRGFYPRYRYRYFFWHRTYGVNRRGKPHLPPTINNGSGGRIGGGSCACACACACAGGGRAGCSRKDFYKPNLKIEKISKID